MDITNKRDSLLNPRPWILLSVLYMQLAYGEFDVSTVGRVHHPPNLYKSLNAAN